MGFQRHRVQESELTREGVGWSFAARLKLRVVQNVSFFAVYNIAFVSIGVDSVFAGNKQSEASVVKTA